MADAMAGGGDFRRLAGMAGVASAALFVVGIVVTFAQGAPPALDASAREIGTYFSNNVGLAKVSALINIIPILFVPLFFAAMYLTFREGGVGTSAARVDGWPVAALIGFIALGVFSTLQGCAALAIALGVKDEFGGQPEIAAALFDLYNAVAPASALAMALLLWSVGNCHTRTGIGPSWLPSALYVGAAAAAISMLAPFLEIDALAFLGLLAFIIFIVWVAVAGMGLMRPSGARATPVT